ncbi:MAG: cyclic nucleotide-binding domain-containing protein [Candidatus Latescibacteria bacterium]|jgi:CRP-like cAMP-binding protein|nr:cyclic nucleotide-binding domain-containing protein [Candidatus Latescibacterota bacterium]MDP7447757.1 cyclic nucleotide-binding domain-containing protein [Candidatus Latescibacterota bacterium]HJP31776.1 cyclic nucleotide-binding domain-containing protein [Candidatus Latescibacterota bacterium]
MALDPFWSNLFSRRDRSGDDLYEILSKVPIFQDLSRREFERMRGILHRRSFSTDEAIVREGDVGVGMYVILSGEVAILQEGTDGKMIELVTFGEGDFFGDQVLLDESARTASAVARSSTRAVGFFRPDLLELIERNPRLGLKIVMRLSHMISVRLRHTNRLLKEARDQARRAEAEAAAQAEAQRAAEEAVESEADPESANQAS